MIWWSLYTDVPKIIGDSCFDSTTGIEVISDRVNKIGINTMQSFNEPGGVVCWNSTIRSYFLGLLLALQVLTLIWFGMILRVAYGVVSGKAAQDSRSDDEDELDEVEEVDLDWDEKSTLEAAVESFTEPIELEVDADEVTGAFTAARAGSPTGRTRSQKKNAARASAISIPGHGDRKELLGRIGCDKPS
jgi:acyl-CoA-dependent ceramide synthase